jgi:hypothetical protein
MTRSSVNRVSRAWPVSEIRPLTWGNPVSEGGLGPRAWWYIPESGIYHHSKLTRQGPSGPAIRRRNEAPAPAHLTGPGM